MIALIFNVVRSETLGLKKGVNMFSIIVTPPLILWQSPCKSAKFIIFTFRLFYAVAYNVHTVQAVKKYNSKIRIYIIYNRLHFWLLSNDLYRFKSNKMNEMNSLK